MLSDFRFALRQLGKSPGFATVAVLSLALGIGANTAVFSVMNTVLLQMLPVRNPHELIVFNWRADERVEPFSSSGWTQREPGAAKTISTSFSVPTFEAFREQATTLTNVFAFAPMRGLTVNIDGVAEIVPDGQLVSGGYHTGLGVTPLAGRLLTPADDTPSAEAVLVISARYWQRRFGGDPSAIGKRIVVQGVPVTIVGVTAAGFNGAMKVGDIINLTLPLALEGRILRSPLSGRSPRNWWVRIMGRLKPGVTAEQARASLEETFHGTIRGHLSMRTPAGTPVNASYSIPLPQLGIEPSGGQGLYESKRGYEKPLALMMGVVGLVLLVACANVANLLLARGAARRREIAVRLALGASRSRIVRQLLAESVLLSSIGALAGLAFAIWGAQALVAMRPFGDGLIELGVSLDWRVLQFTSAVALATGIVFGLAPALRCTRMDLTAEFQGGARTLAGSGSRLAKSQMVAQVALSLVLLVGAALFVRTLGHLQNVDVGFNPQRLLLFGVRPGATGVNGPQAVALYERIRDRIVQLPGVQRAAFSHLAQVGGGNWRSGVTIPGREQRELVSGNGIDPNYLETLEIPLLLGRNFTATDHATSPKVVIVNQTFVRSYFGSENVIGRRFAFSRVGNFDTEIVGVVRDARYAGVKTPPPPAVYAPFLQLGGTDGGSATFVVRFTGDAGTTTTAIRAAVREIDSNLPLVDMRTQEEQIDGLFAQERLFARLCSFFGVLALALSAVGLYGLMSYTVLRRTGEIGVRTALGALPGRVLGMIMRESLGLVFLGIAIGVAAAAAMSKWIASMLFGLSPTDPLTYIAAGLLLVIVATLASLIPARRAAKVDPMTALRAE